jgi:hypothetical protein
MDISELRATLWNAYNEVIEMDSDFSGKSGEAYCQVQYPCFWDCETVEDFSKPEGIMVYSYSLGPSRRHYFMLGEKDTHPNYYTWISKNPLKKAIEIVTEWKDKYLNSLEAEYDL